MSPPNFEASAGAAGPVAGEQIAEDVLVAQAQARDLAAFNQLVVRYQNLAYSVAYRLLQDDAATADAVQESMIKAFRALPSFHGGQFKSWLMRILVNTCYDELRSRKRRQADSLDGLTVEPQPIPSLGAPPESPGDYAERMELSASIERGIHQLPDDQRTALVLCDIHGYSYEEIVEITGWPMGTVKSRINRGRLKLRDMLLQQPELLPPAFRPRNG